MKSVCVSPFCDILHPSPSFSPTYHISPCTGGPVKTGERDAILVLKELFLKFLPSRVSLISGTVGQKERRTRENEA